MKTTKSSDEYLNLLFAQDTFLDSQEFEEHRANVIQRLSQAAEKEKRARKIAVIASSWCTALFAAFYVGALMRIHSTIDAPGWLRNLVALVIILSPLTILLLFSIYFFRYRWEFVRARREARSQAKLEIPRQIADLRKELNDLREQLAKERAAKSPPEKKSEKGFTLLEMLMVVAITGLLASLLLPALAAAKARGRTATCKNNLRQMAHAHTMYEADFGFLPGCGDSLIGTNNYPWDFPSTNSWIVRIQPYTGTNSDIFCCPEYEPHTDWKKTIKSDSFGYNANGSSQIYVDMDKNLGLGFGKDHFIRSTSLAAPADMIEIGDMQLPNSVWCNIISPWHKRPLGNVNCVVPSRHSGGGNIAFCDAHVQWQTQSRWIDENVSARSRWNNDHQPHQETW
jgi:prepilin-type N-terminal cleavage/methylation domain-containing protein/prepilin-type processing-associated H-X9-DG protein